MDIQFQSQSFHALDGRFAHTSILVYHEIEAILPSRGSSTYSVPVRQFKSQLQYLSNHEYQCLSLIDLLNEPSLNRNHKTFVLTFDDGYQDFLEVAYPIILSFGFTATVFLAAGLVGSTSCWEGSSGSKLMSWSHIAELDKAGITFGSHTRTHPRLPSIPTREVRSEFISSKKLIEEKLGHEIDLLAYPYGESNFEIQEIARQSDYQAACGVITGKPGLYNLWRRSIERGDTLLMFSHKLSREYMNSLEARRWLRENTALGRSLHTIKRNWLSRR